MDEEDEYEEDRPASEGAGTTADFLSVKEQTNTEGTEDLCNPVDEVVQATCTDGENGTVVIVKFCWGG